MDIAFSTIEFLTAALAEDVGAGDVTSNAVIPEAAQASFVIRARESLVVAGLIYVPTIYSLLSPEVTVTLLAAESARVQENTALATVAGPARVLLAGERVALNLLQHLCAVATTTRQYVDAVAGTGAQIWDTRKTIPLMRKLQKYAVTCGGGHNHRMGLYDAVMIKDNHIAVAGSVAEAVRAARAAGAPAGMNIQVECDTLPQLVDALAAGVDSVLLDNMDMPTLTQAVGMAKEAKVWSEASGNVNLTTVRAIAETGVNAISIGRLTHSALAVDIGLDARTG